MAIAPCWCLHEQPSSWSFHPLLAVIVCHCFLLWRFVKTRESSLGQPAFSLFQLVYELISGDRKTSLCFVTERAVVWLPGSSGTQNSQLSLLFTSISACTPEVSQIYFWAPSHFLPLKFCTVPTKTSII